MINVTKFLGLLVMSLQMITVMGKPDAPISNRSLAIETINNFIFELHNQSTQERSYTERGNLMYFPLFPWDLLTRNLHMLSTVSKKQLNLGLVKDDLILQSLGLYEWKSNIFLKLRGSDKAKNRVRDQFIHEWNHGKIDVLKFADLDDVDVESDNINDLYKNISDNVLRDIIEPEELTYDTRGVILSTVHFHTSWKYSFYINPKSHQHFYYSNGATREVFMMENEEFYKTGSIGDLPAQFIILPFKDERVNMILIVPEENTHLKEIEKMMTNVNMPDLFAKEPEFINLVLPKFQFKMTYDIYNASLIENNEIAESMYNRKIIQKTFVMSSLFESEMRSFGKLTNTKKAEQFIVNRPFLVIVCKEYKGENIVLFYARVSYPIP